MHDDIVNCLNTVNEAMLSETSRVTPSVKDQLVCSPVLYIVCMLFVAISLLSESVTEAPQNDTLLIWLSRVGPFGEVHLRQTWTATVDPGVVVCRPQASEPLGTQSAAGVEPVQSTQRHQPHRQPTGLDETPTQEASRPPEHKLLQHPFSHAQTDPSWATKSGRITYQDQTIILDWSQSNISSDPASCRNRLSNSC